MEQLARLKVLEDTLDIEVSHASDFRDRAIVSYRLTAKRDDLYLDLPYHNQEHCEDVASIAVYLLDQVATERGKDLQDQRLQEERIDLLIAALFHGAGHNDGELGDRDNLTQACNLVEGMFSDVLEADRVARIKKLISHIGYPYVIPPSSLLGGILVDSDAIATSMRTCSVDTLLYGLLEEMNLKRIRKGLCPIEQHDFLEQQISFYKQTMGSLTTKVAKDLMQEYGLDTLIELQAHIGQYDD